MNEPALELRRLSKTFGGQQALRDVDFAVRAGEVHGLLGQNGSGKSTLIKVLAGFHRPDPGARLRIFGTEVPLPIPPGGFRRYRISFVHQNLGLVPALTVLENLLIARFATTDRWRIDWPREAAAARATFARYGLDIAPLAAVSRLSSVERALVAIVRAVEEAGEGSGVLVLDEPTPFLPRRDVERLFALIRRLAARGAAVIFVSHDIDEVLEITERVTVLRDGQVVGRLVTAESSRDDIVRMIVGRALEAPGPRPPPASGAPTIRVCDLAGGQLHGLSLELRRGEIVGLTGLLGSGYEQVPYLLYGALAASAGELALGGRTFDLRRLSPTAALGAGMVLIPGDRPVAGGVPALPIVDNLALPALGTRFAPWLLRRSAIVAHARRLGETFGIVPNRPELPLSALSGGNQQKVVLAKWLQLDPALMLLDEPTQGVDVGARRTIFRAIRDAAERGTAILCASSDADQLAELCDRVVVLAHGRIVTEIARPALDKHAVVAACYGGTA
ncbi:MAG TPA: sugar ABC transporter ATP-binding protein [Stellaceae bacterium]|nr:sugar ABC transporter ATP-binding protein [Stellaceae bacterium]